MALSPQPKQIDLLKITDDLSMVDSVVEHITADGYGDRGGRGWENMEAAQARENIQTTANTANTANTATTTAATVTEIIQYIKKEEASATNLHAAEPPEMISHSTYSAYNKLYNNINSKSSSNSNHNNNHKNNNTQIGISRSTRTNTLLNVQHVLQNTHPTSTCLINDYQFHTLYTS